MPGIKETLDVLDAAEAVALKAVALGKDGVQLTDGLALVADADIRAKVMTAVDGVREIKGELADLDDEEMQALIMRGVGLAFKIRSAVSKQP